MAIKRPTVFVVGAGASNELGFPLSGNLLERIATALDFIDQYGQATRGVHRIRAEIARSSTQDRIQRIFRAAARVREAAPLGLSIDNIIHQMSDDEDLVYCAKLAIVHSILEAESKCALKVHTNNRKVTWTNAKGTWLGGLAQMVVQDRQASNLGGIFDQITIICFNYDRTIVRFMPFAISSQFGIPIEEAIALTKDLEVIHPYGSIGPLEWQSADGAIGFGAENCDLGAAHENIRTFTEQMIDDAPLKRMIEKLEAAERIAFLGFGYIPQNMDLLLGKVSGSALDVFGTCVGLSEPDQSTVANQLNILYQPNSRSFKNASLVNVECAQFIREHFRTLTS